LIETIPGLLRRASQRWGDRPALTSMREAAASFAKLDHYADQFAKALLADRAEAGERIGIWAPNMWEWVAAAVGAQRIGGTLVPLNDRLRAAEVTDILQRANVTRLVTIGEERGVDFPALLDRAQLPALRRIIILRSRGTPAGAGEIAWERFLELGSAIAAADLHAHEAQVTGDTTSDILFTSGTTGRPKGAMFRHRNSVLSAYGMVAFARVGEADCLCPLGPFSHFAGYKAGWVNSLLTGARVCWTKAQDAESILDAIEALGVTVMPAPPIVWQGVLDHPRRNDWNLSTLRFVATGSTVIPPELIRRLVSELRVEQVGTGYGLTESGGNVTFTARDDPVERVAQTAGRLAPGSEMCIVNSKGEPVESDAPGEILVRTERAMYAYLDDPIATRAALDDSGWLHTGDVGCIDAQGYLRVTDRLKDMYITNGFNVYPAEVERLIGIVPGVTQCAVVGMADPRKGEVGHAFIVRAPGAELTEAKVIDWCRQNVARYKVPAGVTFVHALPRNTQGKVLKNELKALLPG
jgi:acyl-CoA synthetase (AMP-forming)/AMP-acid ligase II